MAQPAFGKAPVIDPRSASAERAFTDLCAAGHIVGFWDNQLIAHHYLTAPPPEPDLDDLLELGWSQAEVLPVRRQWKQGGGRQRLQGCAGWLLTEPSFLEEADRLAARWRALPEPERPAFPLGRAVRVVERPKGARPASPEVASFAETLRAFLDRWGLAGLATWDLPEPQGPLRRPEGRCFPLSKSAREVSRKFTRLTKQAGLKITLHDLRRSFGSRFAAVVPAPVLQRLMRHADIQTTLGFYVDVDSELEEAILKA